MWCKWWAWYLIDLLSCLAPSNLPPPQSNHPPSPASIASSTQLPRSHIINTGGHNPALCPGRRPLKICDKCWSKDWPKNIGLTRLNLRRVFVAPLCDKGAGRKCLISPEKGAGESLSAAQWCQRWRRVFSDHRLSPKVQGHGPDTIHKINKFSVEIDISRTAWSLLHPSSDYQTNLLWLIRKIQ